MINSAIGFNKVIIVNVPLVLNAFLIPSIPSFALLDIISVIVFTPIADANASPIANAINGDIVFIPLAKRFTNLPLNPIIAPVKPALFAIVITPAINDAVNKATIAAPIGAIIVILSFIKLPIVVKLCATTMTKPLKDSVIFISIATPVLDNSVRANPIPLEFLAICPYSWFNVLPTLINALSDITKP